MMDLQTGHFPRLPRYSTPVRMLLLQFGQTTVTVALMVVPLHEKWMLGLYVRRRVFKNTSKTDQRADGL